MLLQAYQQPYHQQYWNTKTNDEELDQARKIVFLETQLELLNNADNTWKYKESLKKELNKCKSENKELKEKMQNAGTGYIIPRRAIKRV